LKIKALLPADALSHQTAILHLAPSLGVGFFSKRSLQIAVPLNVEKAIRIARVSL
jgi:hypothetical protein